MQILEIVTRNINEESGNESCPTTLSIQFERQVKRIIARAM